MRWFGSKLRCALPSFYQLVSMNEPIATVVFTSNFLRQSRIAHASSQGFTRTMGCNFFLGRESAKCVVASENLVGLKRGISSTNVQRVEAKCWSCEEPSTATTPFLICSSCKAIQPLDQDVDFFQLLSVKRSYIQDPKLLERKYKELQKFLHPDMSYGKSEREQGYAVDQSAQVIKAYYTLLDPLFRAQYMLRLSGVNVDQEGTIHDPALLMEIMELREEVEQATEAHKLVKFTEQNKRKMLECENALKEVFESGDIMHAVPVVQRMTYYHKIIEEITRKL